MRILSIFLFCLLIICSCKTESKIMDMQLRDSYIYTFKITYFKKLLTKGFYESDAIKAVIANSQDGYAEPILTLEDLQLMDSLVNLDDKIMIQDSINRIGKVAEGAERKHVFTYALNKFQSKSLDSIAKARWKIFYRQSQAND